MHCSVWRLPDCKQLGVLVGHEWGVTSVAITPDSAKCISASGDETIRCAHGRSRVEQQGSRWAWLRLVAIASTSKHAAAGAQSWTSLRLPARRVWDLRTCTQLVSTHGLGCYINSVCVSPKGHTLLSGAWDNSIR